MSEVASPKESLPKKEEVLISLNEEYRQDKEKMPGILSGLLGNPVAEEIIGQHAEAVMTMLDQKIIGGAHGGPHIAKEPVVLAGIVESAAEKSQVETELGPVEAEKYPLWARLALVITAINHDSGGVPKKAGETLPDGTVLKRDQKQEQAYQNHVINSIPYSEELVAKLPEQVLTDFAISRQELKDIVAVLTMATAVGLNINPAFELIYREGFIGEQVVNRLPLVEILKIGREQGAEALKAKSAEFRDELSNQPEDKQAALWCDGSVYANRLANLADRHENDLVFWQQMENAAVAMAATDHGTYLVRKAIFSENPAIQAAFGQLWQEKDAQDRSVLKHRQLSGGPGTAETFLLGAFPTVVDITYGHLLSPEAKSAFMKNQQTRNEILNRRRGGHDPCLRYEGALPAVGLYDLAKDFGIDENPELQEALLVLSDEPLAATKGGKTSHFSPLSTKPIRIMIDLIRSQKPDQLGEFLGKTLDLIKAGLTEKGEEKPRVDSRIHFSPGAYGGQGVILQMAAAAEERQLPLVFALRQDREEDLNPEFLEEILNRVAENESSSVAVAGLIEPGNLKKILDRISDFNSGQIKGEEIFIHWGSAEGDQTESSESKLEEALEIVSGFLSSRNPGADGQFEDKDKIWLHIDKAYDQFQQWASENPEKWQVLKEGANFAVSPYEELAASRDPANDEFWPFRDWIRREKDSLSRDVKLTAASNNLQGGLGLAIQRFMLDLN